AGDIADLAFKANSKNLQLLTERHDTGRATTRDWLAVGGALLALATVLALVVYATIAVGHALAGR
ncbi:MAG TPA: hypothetical protein VFK02_20200, partial [Kofleriaceae bacterium]|nr:hypothetical protein [Kofleriaceae bacterium]